MRVLRKIMMRNFWEDWKDRFVDNADLYITPDNDTVINAVSSLDIREQDDDIQKAIRAWGYVFKNIDYVLSRRWKTPEETIKEGVADCEDFTFLLASMFETMGIDDHQIRIGDITMPDGRIEQHTWNIVNGSIVDGTGAPNDVEYIDYKTVFEFNINGNCRTCNNAR